MKRGICLILASQLMLLAACGSDVGTGNETTSGSVNSGDTTVTDDGGEKTRLDELGARDLGGRDFVIMDANDYEFRRQALFCYRRLDVEYVCFAGRHDGKSFASRTVRAG